MLLRLLVLLLAVLPLPAAAQEVAGSWVLRVEGTAIFRFDIARDGDSWRGTWARPSSFGSDGNNFGQLAGPPVAVTSSASRSIGEWAELTFPDPRPNAVDDVFRFRRLGPDRLELLYADTGLPPYELVRVAPGAAVGPWEPNKVYRRAAAGAAGPAGAAPALPSLVPGRTTVAPVRPGPVGSVAARPAQAAPATPPPPLSGRDADSRIWSLPPGGSQPAGPAMPTGR